MKDKYDKHTNLTTSYKWMKEMTFNNVDQSCLKLREP